MFLSLLLKILFFIWMLTVYGRMNTTHVQYAVMSFEQMTMIMKVEKSGTRNSRKSVKVLRMLFLVENLCIYDFTLVHVVAVEVDPKTNVSFHEYCCRLSSVSYHANVCNKILCGGLNILCRHLKAHFMLPCYYRLCSC